MEMNPNLNGTTTIFKQWMRLEMFINVGASKHTIYFFLYSASHFREYRDISMKIIKMFKNI